MFNYAKHVAAYGAHGYVEERYGYIVWRRGTGDNVELLHIRAYKPLCGHGTLLVAKMLNELRRHPPYHSVFGYCLPPGRFYTACGFNVVDLGRSVYRDAATLHFSAPYSDLLVSIENRLSRFEPEKS